jgi:hypothetical protein
LEQAHSKGAELLDPHPPPLGHGSTCAATRPARGLGWAGLGWAGLGWQG